MMSTNANEPQPNEPESTKPRVGSIGWRDLTVPDAEGIRDFYEQVVGWKADPVDLGGRVVDGPRSMGGGARMCTIQDPAGAVCALYEPAVGL